MKNKKLIFSISLLITGSLLVTQCKKETETVTVTEHDTAYIDPNDTGTFVPGPDVFDTSWTNDVVHCNVMWESKYYDFSATMLTGGSTIMDSSRSFSLMKPIFRTLTLISGFRHRLSTPVSREDTATENAA